MVGVVEDRVRLLGGRCWRGDLRQVEEDCEDCECGITEKC